MKEGQFIINSALTDLYSKPESGPNLETECLFGQNFNLLKTDGDWVYGFLVSDNYKGWIKKDRLSNIIDTSHKVTAVMSIVKLEPNISSETLGVLLFGSKLKVIESENAWSKFIFFNKGLQKKAYIPNKHIDFLNNKIIDYASIAENFIGAPYKWGGKTFLGIDCSGLVQICLQEHINKMPRNSKDQEVLNNIKERNKESLNRGDLVFWDGHVGIMQNNCNIVHANSHNMCVTIEKLDTVIKRIKKKYNLLPRMYKLNI